MEEAIVRVVATCCQTVLNDEPWQEFGFPRRPKYGALFKKLRPSWKIEIEDTVLKEMVIVLTAAHVVAGVVSLQDIALLVDMYTLAPELVRTFGYASRNEAVIHLGESIEQYAETFLDQWCSTLVTRIYSMSVPNKKFAARLVVGFVRFGTTAQNMIEILKQQSP